MNDIEEREAAVCPEDMGFEEYIAALENALRPFAAMHHEGGDPDEAVLVRGEAMLLNRHLAHAHRLVGSEKRRDVSPECWREEHGNCDCSWLICKCKCHRVEIDYFGVKP